VFHNSVLKRIAAVRPSTLDELVDIKGIGPAKRDQYGTTVLEIVAADRQVPDEEISSEYHDQHDADH
jgi:superfamily II DNA helicase RecQ